MSKWEEGEFWIFMDNLTMKTTNTIFVTKFEFLFKKKCYETIQISWNKFDRSEYKIKPFPQLVIFYSVGSQLPRQLPDGRSCPTAVRGPSAPSRGDREVCWVRGERGRVVLVAGGAWSPGRCCRHPINSRKLWYRYCRVSDIGPIPGSNGLTENFTNTKIPSLFFTQRDGRSL